MMLEGEGPASLSELILWSGMLSIEDLSCSQELNGQFDEFVHRGDLARTKL